MVKRRRKLMWAGIILLLASIGVAGFSRRTNLTVSDGDIPVTAVKRGDLELKIYATGEVRATHSETLTAPPIGGGVLQITHLLPTGTPVNKNQIVIEFDPSEQQYKVEQNRSELEQAEQEITKAKADAAVQAAQDKVALLKAHFEVRQKELDVGKNELLSTIDAKKNNLALDQAKRALDQLEQDIKSHRLSGQAAIGLAEEKRHKAQLAMSQALESIDKMRVRAPMDGVVAIAKNDSIGWWAMSLPDYREGDQTQPGNTIAQVIDPSHMEVSAKISEEERSNVKVGQVANIQLDALPGHTFQGTVQSVGGMVTRKFWEAQLGGRFEVIIQLPNPDPRVSVGFSARIIILGETKKNVTSVPRQALFLKDGKRIVYIDKGGVFEAKQVTIQAETESRAAVEGLKPGMEVALLDPSAPRKSARAAANEPSIEGSTR